MIVGISGKARSGKDTFAEMLAVEMNKGAYPPFILMAFANELKMKCQEAFDLTWDQLWGDDKEVPDKRYIKQPKYQGGVRSDVDELPEPYWTAREIMQNFGAFYRTIDSEFWIKNLFKVAEDKDYKNIIITDVRYRNEAEYIQRKGYVIRVERENKDDVHNMQHPSEVELDDYKGFDYHVINNWGLKELEQAAKDVAKYLRQSEKDLNDLTITNLKGDEKAWQKKI